VKTLRRYLYRPRHGRRLFSSYLAAHVAGDHRLDVGLDLIEVTS
jgi:hypothetical protein